MSDTATIEPTPTASPEELAEAARELVDAFRVYDVANANFVRARNRVRAMRPDRNIVVGDHVVMRAGGKIRVGLVTIAD